MRARAGEAWAYLDSRLHDAPAASQSPNLSLRTFGIAEPRVAFKVRSGTPKVSALRAAYHIGIPRSGTLDVPPGGPIDSWLAFHP